MIMDSCQKGGQSLSPCSETASEMNNNSCSNCKTTKTPMWRTGPSGPKSLCNACGIRYRKKRSVAAEAVGVIAKNGSVEKDKIEKRKNMILMKKKKKGHRLRQWDEVERAALLLVALSCGVVFA